MRGIKQDLLYGLRILRKDIGFSVIAVLTLALGIGANTAIFSLVNGVLLRPLPYPNPTRLVRVFTVTRTQPRFPMAVADFYDYRERVNIFGSSALYAERDLDLTTNDRPEHLTGMAVTHGYFTVLGFHPALGRDFDASEEYKGKGSVVILSDRLWRSHFNSDPNIVGKTLLLSGNSFTVIGVMPPGVQHVGGDFHTPPQGDTVDLWWPLPLLPHDAEGCDRGCHYLNMVARLAPGVSLAEASAAMNMASYQLAKEHPDYAHHILVAPLMDEVVGRARLMLWVLMGAVGFLLLIACVNVANLALSRATGRAREVAMRSVLGAGALRIIRQLLTESLLIAFFGCALGILFAIWGVAGLVALSPDKLPRLQAVHVDSPVLLFAIVVSAFTALLFGLAPALSIARSDINQSLKEGDRGSTSGGGRGRLRQWLVAAEMALALVLLAGAGLLMRTFVNLEHVTMGFNPDHALTFRTELPGKRYPKQNDFIRFYQNLAERLQALPGVRAVGFGSDIPWTGYDENSGFDIEGQPHDPSVPFEARYHFASPDYFRALGIPLLSGRFFTPADDPKSPRVTIVNSAFEHRYFPDESSVGKRLDLWGFKGVQIVGVVGDVKDSPDASSTKPSFYWAEWQFSQQGMEVGVIRADSNLDSIASVLQQQVAALDRDLPVTDVKPMDEVSAHAVSTAKFTWLLVAVFAGLALILAAIGIFGVMSYSVTQRHHEIGIRMALGAQKDDVLGMIVQQGETIASVGVITGLIGSLALTRAMKGLLYGVGAYDFQTFIAVSAVLILVALAACYIPARRASEVDPIVALRYE
ncbi:MAG TPA: ABC transporter permease [Candidatus Acidoferrales bacterium]|nr:ABC transporter permease [Candidatus Acidoferrales bacterium]